MATLGEAFALVRRYQQTGRPAEAESVSRQIVQAVPDLAEGWNGLSQALLALQRADEALAAARRALALDPGLVPAHRTVALALLRQGRVADAEVACARALRIAADHPEILAAQALVRALQGRAQEAEHLFDRALAADSDLAEAHANRATLLAKLGRADEAIAAARRAVDLKPFLVNAHVLLGGLFHQRGRIEEAVQCLTQAVHHQPDHLEALSNLGFLLPRLGRFQEAVVCCLRALAAKPDHAPAHLNLGVVLYRLHRTGQTEAAGSIAEAWLRDHPDNPVARHVAPALLGQAPPERASDAYVRQVFDSYASHFDSTLAGLGYRGPELVAEAIRADGTPSTGVLEVLDAGCGTGLCGPSLRPYARRLAGVDLSPGLLERARARGIYDALELAELTAFLKARPAAFDLIAAADVFCYFGALETVLAAAARSLRAGGRLAFTAEQAADAPDGHRLHPHGRYSHGAEYLRAVLAAAGLAVRSFRPEPIRHENGQPVPGWVILAARE